MRRLSSCWIAMLCFGISMVSGSVGWADEPARDAKLQTLIEKVAEQEARYANYEMVLTDRFKTLDIENLPPGHLRHTTAERTRESRIVHQGEFRFVSCLDKGLIADGTKIDRQYVAGYDGKRTRVYDGKDTTIREELWGERQVRRPHTLLVGQRFDHLSLADYLKGTPRNPRLEKNEIAVEGREEIDGIECIRLKVKFGGRRVDDTEGRKIVWLATTRNYFPIKSVYENSLGLVEEDRVLEWSEIEPGLWIPKKMEKVSNRWNADLGVMVPSVRREIEIKSLDRNPNYPREFFQKVPPLKAN